MNSLWNNNLSWDRWCNGCRWIHHPDPSTFSTSGAMSDKGRTSHPKTHHRQSGWIWPQVSQPTRISALLMLVNGRLIPLNGFTNAYKCNIHWDSVSRLEPESNGIHYMFSFHANNNREITVAFSDALKFEAILVLWTHPGDISRFLKKTPPTSPRLARIPRPLSDSHPQGVHGICSILCHLFQEAFQQPESQVRLFGNQSTRIMAKKWWFW